MRSGDFIPLNDLAIAIAIVYNNLTFSYISFGGVD